MKDGGRAIERQQGLFIAHWAAASRARAAELRAIGQGTAAWIIEQGARWLENHADQFIAKRRRHGRR